MSERQYKDISGNPCSLNWLVRNEPEWAANQIRHRDQLESELADKTGILSDIFVWIELHHPDGFIDGDGFVEQLDKIMDRYHEKRESLERELEVLKAAKIPAMVSEKDRLILTQELAAAKAKLAKQSAECLMWARSSDKNDEKAFHLEMDIAALKAECDQLKAQVAEAKALDDIATNLAEKLDNWRECARELANMVKSSQWEGWSKYHIKRANQALATFDRLEKEIQ
jgi:DNA mismatch repair ATPase MutS